MPPSLCGPHVLIDENACRALPSTTTSSRSRPLRTKFSASRSAAPVLGELDDLRIYIAKSEAAQGLDQDLDPGLGLLARQFGLCLGFGHGYINREVERLGDVPSR